MATPTFVLEEVLAMLEAVGVPAKHVTAFREQAEATLAHQPARGEDHVWVNSGFGVRTRRGFVTLEVNEARSQMDTKKAREIGFMLIEAAEAGESDEIVATWLTQHGVANDPDTLGQILLDLRAIRHGTRGSSRPS